MFRYIKVKKLDNRKAFNF